MPIPESFKAIIFNKVTPPGVTELIMDTQQNCSFLLRLVIFPKLLSLAMTATVITVICKLILSNIRVFTSASGDKTKLEYSYKQNKQFHDEPNA